MRYFGCWAYGEKLQGPHDSIITVRYDNYIRSRGPDLVLVAAPQTCIIIRNKKHTPDYFRQCNYFKLK